MKPKRPVFRFTEENDSIYKEYSTLPLLGRLKLAFESDERNGQYRMDRILARRGELTGDPTHGGNHDGDALMTRGRALYMYEHDPSVLGFGGVVSYCQPMEGTLLSVSLRRAAEKADITQSSPLPAAGGREFPHPDEKAAPSVQTAEKFGEPIPISENKSARVNMPSHWHGEYSAGSLYIRADKYITGQNCAVLLLRIENEADDDIDLDIAASSDFARERYAVYPNDREQGELRMRFPSCGRLTNITARMTAKNAARPHHGETALKTRVRVPAHGGADYYALIVFSTVEIPESEGEYLRLAALAYDRECALSTQTREYNEYWHKTVPFIDTPSPSVNKAIDYRHWLERFNTLDAAIPGYDFQYPTTIEGVLGYNNAIVLTQPMHLEDTKWQRTPRLPYGQLLSVAACSRGSAFLDNPGNRNSWNNHYGQYIAAAGRDAFFVHGGGRELALYLAESFEGDAKGQLEHYGGHADGKKLIAYRANYMTGNDADTISMHAPGVGEFKLHGENAYVFAAARSSSEMYALAGEAEKSRELASLCEDIRADILSTLWCRKCRMFETLAVLPEADFCVHNESQPRLIPYKESNSYNYFSMGVPPVTDEYREAFRFLSDAEEFPVFPYYTASQRDNREVPGSNNFSNINFTVQAHAYEAALRTYDREHKYVTPEMLAAMTEWCAWCVFPDGGDVRFPNNSEFFNADNASDPCGKGDFYRSWIYHNVLGNYIYIFIEDMAGLRPRADSKIELDPIDFGYGHFAVDNLLYHGRDVAVVNNVDGTYPGMPRGYSLFIDGALALALREPCRAVYDPESGAVETDGEVLFSSPSGALPSALDTSVDPETKELLKLAGLTDESLSTGARVTATYTPKAAREAMWEEKHRSDGEDSSSLAVNECAPDPAAVTDGKTVSAPFWGNDGSVNDTDSLTLTLDKEQTFDTLAIWFYDDRQPCGYSYPERYLIEYYRDGWQSVTTRSQTPRLMCAGRNESRFDAVTSDRVRITVKNRSGHYTAITEARLMYEGTPRRAVMNHGPDMYAHSRNAGGLKAVLSVEVVDDGMPFDRELSYVWHVEGAPEGAEFTIENAEAAETTMTVSRPGRYRVNLHCTDGEIRRCCTHEIEITE